ncbi:uncharacterized protein LOC122536038, partial [Frieseomelitta varia]|uniref:uncharacterized protein LOC122536038 n=1 Tax=Frieseomelitta varia TaxID=561572 RepID=UPI001CB6AAE6
KVFRTKLRLSEKNSFECLSSTRALDQDSAQSLEDIPLEIRRNLIYQQDGAPSHFSREARNFLNENYQYWIGRNGRISWSPRSPDLSPLDFYLRGHVKSMVYSSDTANVEQLKEKIIIAFATLKLQNNTLENVRSNLIRRAQLCMQQREHHFQQFLN